MTPQELSAEEEAHYYHTIQYFNQLVRTHGAKVVLEDLKTLDLDTYDKLCYTLLEESVKKSRSVAAIFRDTFTTNAN